MRIVFERVEDVLIIRLVGNHDDVKRFLRGR
jgi:hypothetical protein